MQGLPLLPTLLLGTALLAQSDRTVSLLRPAVPGQTAQFALNYPYTAHYHWYAFLAATPPLAASTPFSLPGYTVLGQPTINPANVLSTFVGQIQPNTPVVHTMAVPNDPALAGTSVELQTMDWSIPSRIVAFSDNELLMAIQTERWRTPTVLSTTAGSEQPRLALRAQGDGVGVWVDRSSTGQIVAARYSPTTGWSPIETAGTGQVVTTPDVGIDAAGNAFAVWLDVADNSVWASRQPAGSTWSAPVLLENNAGDAGNPRIAVDSAGNAIAVWWQYDGAFNSGVVSVFAARFTPAGGWSPAVAIENDNQSWGEPPSIACDAAGNATVVWRWGYQVAGTWFSTVMTNRYTTGSGWGTATAATTDNRISGNVPPRVTVDDLGNALAIWEAYAPGNSYLEVHAARWTGGSWGPTTRLDPTTPSTSRDPQVQFTGGGNAVAVWWELDGSGKILTATLQNGSWSPAATAIAPIGTWATVPEFQVDGSGRITITYRHGTPGTPISCFHSQFLPGVGWLTPYRIDDDNHNGFGSISLGRDSARRVVALMTEQWTNGTYKVVATEFR